MGIFGHGLGSGFRNDSDDGGGGTLSGILAAMYAVETGSDTAAVSGDVADNINVEGFLAAQEAATLDTMAVSAEWTFIDPVTGDLDATDASVDSVAFTVFVADGGPVSGTMAAQETGSDLADMPGSVFYPPVDAAMAAVETGADVLAISGSVADGPNVSGTLSVQETGADVLEASGTIAFVDPVTGTMAAQEAAVNDAFAATGDINDNPPVTGTLAATETGSDTFAATGTAGDVTGTMAPTESGADTFAATGTVAGGVNVTGTLAATETGSDAADFSGTIASPDITGTMAATESAAADTMSTTGGFVADGPNLTGTMAVTEAFGADTMETTGGNVANNNPPVITSNGGGASASVTVGVGDTFVTQVVATDEGPVPLTYSVSGGADSALFTIDSETGELRFVDPAEEPPAGILGDQFDDGAGGAVDNWTARFVTANVTWTENASGYAQAVTTTSSTPRLLAFDTLGTAENIEVLVKVRAPASQAANGQYAGVVLRGSGTSSTYTGYRFQLGRNSGNTTNTLICSRWVNGTNTSITSPAFAWTTTNLYWIRARVNGTTIQARAWLDGNSEPGTWLVNTTDANVTGAGWAGLLCITSGHTYEYHEFYYALNGDTAVAGGGSPVPYEVTVRATDGPGLFDEQTISVDVDVVPTGTMDADEAATADTMAVSGEVEVPQTLLFEWDVDEGLGQTLADETAQSRPGQLGSTTGAEASDPVWDSWIANQNTGDLTNWHANSVSGTGSAITAATPASESIPSIYSTHVIKATCAGSGSGFARVHFIPSSAGWSDFVEGSDFWYGGWVYLPTGFYTARSSGGESSMDLMRWDAFVDGSGDMQGGFGMRSDNTLRIMTNVPFTEPLTTSYQIPEATWTWIEVHQILSQTDGVAYNEIFADGVSKGSSTTANYKGTAYPSGERAVNRVRFGIVSEGTITATYTLYMDKCFVSSDRLGSSTAGSTGVTLASGDYIRNQGSAAYMNGLGGACYLAAMTMPATIVNGGVIVARDDSSGSTRQFRLYTTTTGAVEFIGYAGGSTAGAGSTLTSSSGIVTGGGTYLFQVNFELDDTVQVWVSDSSGSRVQVINSTRSNGTMSDALTVAITSGSSLNGTTGVNTMTGAKVHYVAGHAGGLDATGLTLAWNDALAALNAKGVSLGAAASIPGSISDLSVTDGTTTSLDVTYTPASGAQTHQYRVANHGPTVSKSILWDQWRTDGGWAPVGSGNSARCPAIGTVNRFIKAEEDIKSGKKAFVLEIVEYNRVGSGWLAGGVADDNYSGGQLGTGGTTSTGVTHTGIWRNGAIASSAVVWPDFTFGGGNVGQKLLVLVDMATRNVWFQNLTTGTSFGDPVAGTNGMNVTGTGAIIPTLQNNNCLANVRMDTWCKGVTLPSGYSALGKSGIPPRPIYVTKSGNDTTGNGTVGAPYLTIAAGIADLGPGETVWVGDGVYDEKITITRSGCTAGAPARVMAMNQHLAILRESTDSQTYAVTMGSNATSGAYNQIIGFDIDGSSSETTRRGVNMTSTGQVTARCKVHDIRVTAAADSTGGGGIVTNGGFYQSGAHYIDDCIIYRVNNGAGDRLHNIYFQTLAGRVSNNMSFLGRGGAHSEGIATWHDNKNTLFSHNLCYNNRTHGFNWGAGDIYNDPTMSGHIYINNIAYNNPSNGYIQRSGGTGVIGANQGLRLVAFDNDAGNYNNMTAGGSTNTLTITTSPSFVNYLADGTGDYHPTSTGNQVNAGTSLPSTNTTGSYNLPWRDLDGHVRTGATPDIGPYEYRPTGTFGSPSTLSGDEITGLDSGTSYEVQVRGVNGLGSGSWSNSDTESTW